MKNSIDSLPESLILQCLARLHLNDIPIASRVCRKWLHLVGSRHFYTLRKQLGFTNQVACLLQQAPLHLINVFGPMNRDCNRPPQILDFNYLINLLDFNYLINDVLDFNYLINFFDPMNRDWNRLPPIPNFTKELRYSTIAASEGKLVVFTDCDPESCDPVKSMFVLDFSTQRWRRVMGMPTIRTSKFSTAASQCHRIFISCQEEGLVWEYDAWKDEWIMLHQVRGMHIVGLKVIGEELWVINRCRETKMLTKMLKFVVHVVDVVDAYHFQTEKWRKVEMAPGEIVELLCSSTKFDIELYELMKNLSENSFSENNFKVLKKCFRIQLGKQCLVMAPFIMEGCYAREELFYMQGHDGNFERMQPSSSEFSSSEFCGDVASCCCVEF